MAPSLSNFEVENSTFEGNVAKIKGGALQYNYIKPEVKDNVVFNDN